MFASPWVFGITPCGHPAPRLVAALCRAGAIGVLDTGSGGRILEDAVQATCRITQGEFGIRIPEAGVLDPASLPPQITTIILPKPAPFAVLSHQRLLVQVTTEAEANEAVRFGAFGLIAKGCESGGRVGDESAFVLLQRLAGKFSLPVFVQGGMGLHTSAAAIAGGAAGIVIDAQLALVRESDLPDQVQQAISAMDGSETTISEGVRLFARPGVNGVGGHRLQIGQDGVVARSFAKRFGTAGRVVQALQDAMVDHVQSAKSINPLGPGSALAAAHGITYPIAQGPMTRVSDRPAFADAVSKAGGLPFLALALTQGEALRTMLTETQSLLKDRTWGVGILGFVPPDIREEQLKAVLEVRPPVALVAGGRPGHIRSLEAAGIAAYLHVPSPGLLDLFLKDGVRKFVFEGSECGGHVGPRTSFALWEVQIEQLLAFGSPEELHVLFAGGIHDAASAAMVAAMAATIAARGAKVGVLMGTAYIFTREAVATGAITPAFQRVVSSCNQTALLETAPGHATRCVETEYVHFFRKERLRLEQDGNDASKVWEELEQLNLGRLRIASKGIRREGHLLETVSDQAAERDGLFMIGQVASLREDVCSIADLHRDVSEGSTAILAKLEIAERTASTAPPPVDVAIVGMACVFPGAPDLETYWANIVNGVNSITEVPKERWDPALYYDPKGRPGETTPSKWGGFVPDIAFDPLVFGIPPRSLAAIEPVQLLSLEVARRALADAGYAERDFNRERTSVIFGAEAGADLANAYAFRAFFPQLAGPLPQALAESLPSLTEDSFPGVLSNVIAGRIANRLNLGGANYTVDAACASSLAAVDLACKELVTRTSDMVVCGGADFHNSIADYLLFSSVQALSPNGQCRTFDADADGIVLGEGVGVAVLKRLEDAERDGDRIYAVIRGVGASSDGRSLGLTAPRKDGQILAVNRAFSNARISPSEIGLIEAHGTGTIVGDATELATLDDVFTKAGTALRSCRIGSVKSQIGHTKCAAGMAGLIKVALSLHRSVLPPTLNIRRPNPTYDSAHSPFAFTSTAQPWTGDNRKAGMSAFGFGGTNFHAILTAPNTFDPPASGIHQWPAELFLFKGTNRSEAFQTVGKLERWVANGQPCSLRDLAFSVSTAGDGPVQVALVAANVDDLKSKLERVRNLTENDEEIFFADELRGSIAFVFPGQGSQRPGMLSDMFVAFPALQRYLRLGSRWQHFLFPQAAFSAEDRTAQIQAITDTRVAQPTLGIVSLALAELLHTLGIHEDLLGGHSYGELAALAAAGIIPESAVLSLSEARGLCILEAAGDTAGGMAAVRAAAADIVQAIADFPDVVVANQNAPDQQVIAGPSKALSQAVDRLRAIGISAQEIPVACAFHSPMIGSARESFERVLADVEISPARVPVWSNATASCYPDTAGAIRKQLADQLVSPVLFENQVQAMYEAGARIFVEVGPGRVLTGLIGRILKGKPHLAVACDQPGQSGIHQLLLALGRLSACGVPLQTANLFAGRETSRINLDEIKPVSASTWMINGHTARPQHGDMPDFAMRPALHPVHLVRLEESSVRETVISDYLGSMRDLVQAQRDVMMRFLGSESPAAERNNGPAAERNNGPAAERNNGRNDGRKNVRAVRDQDARKVQTASAAKPDVKVVNAIKAPPKDPATELLAIVSSQTGYPVQMLDLDLDIEADLSIDSIKRIEIIGALDERLGFRDREGMDRDKAVEQLVGLKTLRSIAAWLDANLPAREEAGGAATQDKGKGAIVIPDDPSSSSVPVPLSAGVTDLRRCTFNLERTPAAVMNGFKVQGRRFLLTEDPFGVSVALRKKLEAKGAVVEMAGSGAVVGNPDVLIHLASLSPDPSPASLNVLFDLAQRFLPNGATHLLAATPFGGTFGHGVNGSLSLGGMAGFVKSVAKEWPALHARVVDLDTTENIERLAEHLLVELLADDDLLEVGYTAGARQVRRISGASLPENNGLMDLGADSIVLVTGGARGITAQISIALAKRWGCRLELVGRSPLQQESEAPEIAAARSLPEIRKAIIAAGHIKEPGRVEAMAKEILAAREICGTLAAIRAIGSPVTYHSVDIRNTGDFATLIESIYSRFGRIDGVIHGAGIIEDKLLSQKTADSFRRVFETKVSPALTLVEKIRPDVKFVIFFSSVAGVFGNRGQTDYAAASEALDKLASSLASRVRGRVLSINWGPWSDVGMVSPQLQKEYIRRGVRTITPAAGVKAFIDELCRGDRSDVQVAWLGESAEILL